MVSTVNCINIRFCAQCEFCDETIVAPIQKNLQSAKNNANKLLVTCCVDIASRFMSFLVSTCGSSMFDIFPQNSDGLAVVGMF